MNNATIHLRTKIEVKHLNLSNISKGGQREGKIDLYVGGINVMINADVEGAKSYVQVAYVYFDDQGKEIPTEENRRTDIVGISEIDAQSKAIHGNLPDDENLRERILNEIEQLAIVGFAARFGIKTSDIEKVTAI